MRKVTPYSVTSGTLVSLICLVMITIIVVLSPAIAVTSLVVLGIIVAVSKNWAECRERLDEFFGGLWRGFRDWLRNYPKTFTEDC